MQRILQPLRGTKRRVSTSLLAGGLAGLLLAGGLAGLLLFAGGCGQRGPLYLPDQPPKKPSASATPPPPAAPLTIPLPGRESQPQPQRSQDR